MQQVPSTPRPLFALSPMLKFAAMMQQETLEAIWEKLKQGFVLIEQRQLSCSAWMELYKSVFSPALFSLCSL
jgi:hypothetical protein